LSLRLRLNQGSFKGSDLYSRTREARFLRGIGSFYSSSVFRGSILSIHSRVFLKVSLKFSTSILEFQFYSSIYLWYWYNSVISTLVDKIIFNFLENYCAFSKIAFIFSGTSYFYCRAESIIYYILLWGALESTASYNSYFHLSYY
jgi:hypothetical protein